MKRIVFIALLLTFCCTPVLANNLGFGVDLKKVDNNLFIDNVIQNSLAEKQGLQSGQKIIKFNGKSVDKVVDKDLENIDTLYKSLKLVTDENKQYNLKREDITLLQSYNQVNKTFNENTKYKIKKYTTEKLVMKDDNNEHIKYMNAYFNYADAVSIENSELYVELFKVTDENVKKALKKYGDKSENEYANLYNQIYKNNRPNQICSTAFRYFLELAIYHDVNQDLIAKQISEFNEIQKKQYAQFIYNTKIVANLYMDANYEREQYLYDHTINANIAVSWEQELIAQYYIYDDKYEELLKSLSKSNIKITKPSQDSNVELQKINIVHNNSGKKEQIVALAQEKGYVLPNNSTPKNEVKTVEDYTKVINSTSDPYEKAENYAYRALEYMLTNNYNMAISDATKSIQIGFDKSKYDFVEWALTVYYTRAISYQNTKNYTAAIADYTTYIQKATEARKYYYVPHMELLLGNCYYLRVVTELEQYPLIRSKADGKVVHYANMHNDMLRKFSDLEMAIKIYSGIDSPQAKEKKAISEGLLSKLKAAYYK